jgi:hypothetical protein
MQVCCHHEGNSENPSAQVGAYRIGCRGNGERAQGQSTPWSPAFQACEVNATDAPPSQVRPQVPASPDAPQDAFPAVCCEVELRVAPDGKPYIKQEFLSFFGSHSQWAMAPGYSPATPKRPPPAAMAPQTSCQMQEGTFHTGGLICAQHCHCTPPLTLPPLMLLLLPVPLPPLMLL